MTWAWPQSATVRMIPSAKRRHSPFTLILISLKSNFLETLSRTDVNNLDEMVPSCLTPRPFTKFYSRHNVFIDASHCVWIHWVYSTSVLWVWYRPLLHWNQRLFKVDKYQDYVNLGFFEFFNQRSHNRLCSYQSWIQLVHQVGRSWSFWYFPSRWNSL